jgi:hypothetical protein
MALGFPVQVINVTVIPEHPTLLGVGAPMIGSKMVLVCVSAGRPYLVRGAPTGGSSTDM